MIPAATKQTDVASAFDDLFNSLRRSYKWQRSKE